MDFAVFSEKDIKQMYHSMVDNMVEAQKEIFVKEYGSMEEFEKHFMIVNRRLRS